MGRILIAVALAGALFGSMSQMALAAPAGEAGIAGPAQSPIVEAAACGRHFHLVPAHRDGQGHRVRGHCVRDHR